MYRLKKKSMLRRYCSKASTQNPKTGHWAKRDKETGQIMEVKDEPYQAVPREH